MPLAGPWVSTEISEGSCASFDEIRRGKRFFSSPRNLITLVLQDGARLLVRSSTDQGVATAQNPRKRIFPLQDL
jgi:hypothetical protein